MKLRAYKAGDVMQIEFAIKQLRIARSHLRAVGATKALRRVKLALTSTEGALRHAIRLKYQDQS